MGTHHELTQTHALYREFAEQQFGGDNNNVYRIKTGGVVIIATPPVLVYITISSNGVLFRK